MKNKIRIGSGAGYAGDRIEPAIDLMERGDLDYIIFECLAERTISIAQQQKRQDPSRGYNELLEYRFDRIFDVLAWQESAGLRKVKVITNMGAANPQAAAEKCLQLARAKGLDELNIAWVSGDDIFDRLDAYDDLEIMETGQRLASLDGEKISANGYLGCEGIVRALQAGADIVITGRVADPALTLGPLVYEFGWSMDDYDKLGKGTLAGHLLECAGQITGGYFADPGCKDVPELWNLGFPIAEVSENGNCIITKLSDTGGMVTEATVKEQLLYEIQDPASYYTPDVTADFSKVIVCQNGTDMVAVTGASGRAPNGFYKTSIGYHNCYIGIGEISYGGCNAMARAKLAREVLEHRFTMTGLQLDEVRFDYIGYNALYGDGLAALMEAPDPIEVRLRVAARSSYFDDAKRVGEEVEALYTNGPAGGGGTEKSVKDIVSIASVLIPSEDFDVQVHFAGGEA